MADNEQFIAGVGSAKTLIIDFKKLLSLEADPSKQATLRTLLVDELDKLTKQRAALNDAEHRVREGRVRLERTKTIKTAPKRLDDHGLVGAMEMTQSLLENFHRRLLKDLPDSNKLQDAIVGAFMILREARRRALS
jgi:hypothetical protein